MKKSEKTCPVCRVSYLKEGQNITILPTSEGELKRVENILRCPKCGYEEIVNVLP